MAWCAKKAMEFFGEPIQNYSGNPKWDSIIKLMNDIPTNFSHKMIFGEDFDSFNTITILDLDRDIDLRFLDEDEMIDFLKDVNFISYANSYKNYHDQMKKDYPNRHIDDFNFFIKNSSKNN